jgi:ribosomal protein L11 methyltransferase
MFVWRRRASTVWLAANEATLREVAGQRLAIISRPGRKNAIAEIAGSSRRDLEKIRSRFGGTIEQLSRDWLRRFSGPHAIEPIRIGKRLIIYRSVTSKNKSSNETRSLLIPAGAAFGTGEHTTTAMSLRLLGRCTRVWGAQAASLHSSAACRRRLFKEGSAGSRTQQASSLCSPKAEWTLLDLGTGSGILALAAARFGAKRVIAIDHDPIAISTARANARRNKIDNIDFRVADVRRWKFPKQIDTITANLFSDLLIEILPKLKRAQWLILSGILREVEAQLVCALKRNGIVVVETRRRGKWIAIACHPERSRLPRRSCMRRLGGMPRRKL